MTFSTYANDMTITSTLNIFKRSGNLNSNVNQELTKTSDWLKVSKLSLDVNKTEIMIFHMPQKKVEKPVLQINGTIIEYVNNVNFLGIAINSHLNCDSHSKTLPHESGRTLPHESGRTLPPWGW